MAKIRVLSVDDSALMRKLISEGLAATSDIEVIATAPDPFVAAEKIKTLQPDVLTLDIEMPRMDGITFLTKLMRVKPMPVIMVSSLTERGARKTLEAIEAGATDFILKPDTESGSASIHDFTEMLADKIRSAHNSKAAHRVHKLTPVVCDACTNGTGELARSVIALGASTGGTEVITCILQSLPQNLPGFLITQHMPPKFTRAFADRINTLSKLTVKEAQNNDKVQNGFAYIAPGGLQMELVAEGDTFRIDVNDGPARNRHKPSVDVLFESVAKNAGSRALGIICTGMGADGAEGMALMKEKGAETIAQDEESSVIFGMPKEAIRKGVVDHVADVSGIIKLIVSRCSL